MNMHFPAKVKILVDSREKKGHELLFPPNIIWHPAMGHPERRTRIEIETRRLDAGDYLLANWPKVCIVERKGSGLEIWGNLMGRDRPRASKAFSKLSDACENAYLLIEGGLPQISRDLLGSRIRNLNITDVGPMWDALIHTIIHHHLHTIFTGPLTTPKSKRIVGDFVLRLLLSHAYDYEMKKFKEKVLCCPKTSTPL